MKKRLLALLLAPLFLAACWNEAPNLSVTNLGCQGSTWHYRATISAQTTTGTWRVSNAFPGELNGSYSNHQNANAWRSTNNTGATIRARVTETDGGGVVNIGPRYFDNPCR